MVMFGKQLVDMVDTMNKLFLKKLIILLGSKFSWSNRLMKSTDIISYQLPATNYQPFAKHPLYTIKY